MGQLKRDPVKFKHYDKVIQDQVKMGFVEKVEENRPKLVDCHYLPHHSVAKESSSTPLRVVFNCSSKCGPQQISLNDCLMTGPSLTKKLVDVLVRFRKGQFVYTADIEEAFLQVGLQEVDRDYTRFLWVKDMEAQPVKFEVFRFRSVLFGSTASPFLLQATLTKHLSESENPLGAKILEQFYVDNFQGTCDT